jgi:hypothetical protein
MTATSPVDSKVAVTVARLVSKVVDETQRYQLCHYDVVVAQLAALGFIKSV